MTQCFQSLVATLLIFARENNEKLQSWTICRLFHILAQFPFNTNETELDYYHQKVNV